MDPERHLEAGDVGRYEALLQMADLVVHHRDVPELLPELAKRLRKVASFEIASLCLHDPEKNVMRVHFWEAMSAFRILPNYRWKNRLVDSCGKNSGRWYCPTCTWKPGFSRQ
jgi:hypothetical protein